MGEPALSLFYKVTIDGVIPLGTWSKIEGLGFSYDVKEYREGGVNGYMHKLVGPLKYDNVRLSRPVDSDSMLLYVWLSANLLKVVPQTMEIMVMNSEGKEVTTWNLSGVVPVKWQGPSLDIMGNQIAMETLEVAYSEMLGLGGAGAALLGAASALL
ncbi:MAG TPA: phage tail protein [Candidatus Limnocylindrales bacterium]|jgi:phage tail-like protein|nr:phage tail protein [Candidatus Limnocylindrales bacterium]